tara:strand:+ start:2027 stop:2164 length:138 start_codon:yes stop_codon:yes gene_type:complete
MKYEKILTKKFLNYLSKIKKDKTTIDKEEKFFNKFKKAVENIKKE